MNKVYGAIRQFFQDETGATAIEYGLLVGLIAAVIVAVVTVLGTTLDTVFLKVLCKLGGTVTGKTCPA